jgi:demethylmenaquinone methyltransferase/2-methoxy-6-polyprenyl-1,4-benzoquinol methylase
MSSPSSDMKDAQSAGGRAARVWDEGALADPHADAAKHEKVRRMFGAIAGSYDLNNRVHSLWRDQAWRRFAVRRAHVLAGDVVLDCACGTGDLTEAFARAGAARVVGLDFTQEMLDVAAGKRARLDPSVRERLHYVRGDAQALPFDDASFDVVSIAFGIRNVVNPAVATGEFRRVLRPGGRVVVLEFARPGLGPVRWFNDIYCKRVMPRTATLISGDRSGAYRYLPASVETFLSRAQMEQMLRDAGFAGVRSRALTLGICVCYLAHVPAL